MAEEEKKPSVFAKIRKEYSNGRILTYFPLPFWIVQTKKTQFLNWFRRFAVLAVKLLPVIAFIGIAMMVFQVWLAGAGLLSVAQNPVPARLASPRNILLLPGVNEFVPLSAGVLFALFLAMLLHELAHGIFARVYDVKVKAVGFIIALVFPVAAFVDMDEEQLKKENWMKRVAVAAVGPYMNIFCGLLVFLSILVLIDFNFAGYGLLGFLILLVLPIDPILGNNLVPLHHLAIAYSGMSLYMHFVQFFFWFGWISLMLGIANLIPVLPLDGGHVLHAVLERTMQAKAMKRFEKYNITATKVAAVIMLGIIASYATTILWVAFFGS